MIRIMTRILIPNMMLELKKVSSQQNLASDVEPVTELSMCVRAKEKFEEDFNAFMCQSNLQEKSSTTNHEKLNSCLMQKFSSLENEKSLLHWQSVDLQNQNEELKLQAQNSEKSLRDREMGRTALFEDDEKILDGMITQSPGEIRRICSLKISSSTTTPIKEFGSLLDKGV